MQTTLHAYLRMGSTTYGYDSEVGGADVLKALVKLKQYVDKQHTAADHDGTEA